MSTKEALVHEIAAMKEAPVHEIAAMDETGAVNKSDAVDKAAAEDASPAYHDMAPAVAHCGKPNHPRSLTATFGACA